MKRVHQGVLIHQDPNNSSHLHQLQHSSAGLTSHELDAKDMRAILTQLFAKTLDMKRHQKETNSSNHHHYEGVFRESANIDKPPNFDKSKLLSLKKSPPLKKSKKLPKKSRMSFVIKILILMKNKYL